MDTELIGILVILFVFILMFFRVPIAISMAIPACIGVIYLKDLGALISVVNSIVWDQGYNYTLLTVPLFVLMGHLLYSAGISSELFTTFRLWFGKFKGGLGLATIGSSAMFGASTGSSLATTGTMGVIATKEMLQAGYDKSLTGGSIVAGGTLGILIPPSTTFIIYGMITEQSIGKLLLAGILPGILLTILFMITIYLAVTFKPSLVAASAEEYEVSWKERFISLKSNLPIVLLFIVVIGGIYLGIFTVTESAGVGAFGAFIIGITRRKMNMKNFKEALFNTITTTGFLFAIIIGAFILNYVLVITRIPYILADLLTASELSPTMIFILIVCMYIILGALMDTIAMLVVTVPIILPIVDMLGFDLIWFGVIIVLLIEMALITPPVGMNCFVLNGVTDQLTLSEIFKGALLFVIPILVLIILIYIFPEIALFIPNNAFG
ncbi:tripartite ATP-independent transporter DctM subunit [Neobacillus niacini]|uniref:TRAP transporter large permease n=1 Tax=Neobacillus niacini TaxID=86668 RepID=UPI002856E9DE|nr:TRAP transporter large permease [Neobacillus niacini]MDR7079766.1 tripartite ATP-independent transporter DctM subunit [Neobacillus niacini]